MAAQTTGTLLPGETATTSFSFKSADPGVFGDRWRLETAPTAAFALSAPPAPALAAAAGQSRDGPDREAFGMAGEPVADRGRSNKGGEGNGGGRAMTSGVVGKSPSPAGGRGGVEVDLRGVALAPDTREHARKRLEAGVSRGVFAAKVEEIVREVVRDVRTPVREEEVRTGYARRRLVPPSPVPCCHWSGARFRSCVMPRIGTYRW